MNPMKPSPAQRIVAVAFGACFGGTGLTVLALMWLAPGGFGSPPLIFRVVGSFIAIPFVAIGATLATGGLFGRSPGDMVQRMRSNSKRLLQSSARNAADAVRGGYTCPRCAAPLGDGADVSPSGDVKCTYCRSWFNVRRG